MWDVIIIGGGAAGLSAALVLGRARRAVLVLSGGAPRNAPAAAAHGFLSRDGTPPLDLLAIAEEQLEPYATVQLRHTEATSAAEHEGGFVVSCADGAAEHSRKLLLATGVADELPPIRGIGELWGRGVFHCPYCHGWEVRDQPLAIIGDGPFAMHMAPLVRQWSRDLLLLTNGPSELSDADRGVLSALAIGVEQSRIDAIERGANGQLLLRLEAGRVLERGGVFVPPRQHQRSRIALELGCTQVGEGPIAELIDSRPDRSTNVPGVYVAGDMARDGGQQLVQAAASGAQAAAMLNYELVREDVALAAATLAGAELNAAPTAAI